jgi:excisionase family DNA binding protein
MDDANDRAEEARKGSPFLTTRQAARYIGLAIQTLEKMRRERRGPPYRKHGRFVRYHIAELDAWSKGKGTRKTEPPPDKPDDSEPKK